MAKYIYNKYYSTSTVTYKWRKYNLDSTKTYTWNKYSITNSGYRWERWGVQGNVNGGALTNSYDYVTSSNINEYPNPGYQYHAYNTTWFYYKNRQTLTNKGSYIGTVSSTSSSAYPTNGKSGSYWYDTRTSSTSYSRGSYIGKVSSSSSTTYPTDGKSGSYWYDTRTSSTSYSRGSYIGEVTAEDGTYPANGRASDGYWYVRRGLANQAPIISGSNLDLGNKSGDFSVDYIVSDADGNAVTVDVLVNGEKKEIAKPVILGVKYSYDISISDFTLGNHQIEIIAKDSEGASSLPRIYTFSKVNSGPQISGMDEHLGNKSKAFTIYYSVADPNIEDTVSVSITLDGKQIASVSSAQDKELQITITDEMLKPLIIGKDYSIVITADDGKGGKDYRTKTFTKANVVPIISDSDTQLDDVVSPPTVNFSFTDVEDDRISAKVFLNDVEVMDIPEVVDGEDYSYTISHDRFIKVPYNTLQTIQIKAWDDFSVNKPAIREYTFKRVSDGIDVEMQIGEQTINAKKVVVVPNGTFANDAVISVKVCNNYLDENPTWEELAEVNLKGQAYVFTNTTKTADMWAVGVWYQLESGTIISKLNGFKGGYET